MDIANNRPTRPRGAELVKKVYPFLSKSYICLSKANMQKKQYIFSFLLRKHISSRYSKDGQKPLFVKHSNSQLWLLFQHFDGSYGYFLYFRGDTSSIFINCHIQASQDKLTCLKTVQYQRKLQAINNIKKKIYIKNIWGPISFFLINITN